MSLSDCITRAVEGGQMDAARARDAQELYSGFLNDYRRRLPEIEAARLAGADTKKVMRERLTEKRRRVLLQVQAYRRAQDAFDTYRNARGDQDYGAAAKALIDPSDIFSRNISSVEARRKVVLGLLHSHMDKFLRKHRRTITGAGRDKADLVHLIKELHGENTGNASARELANAWRDTAEAARLMYNAAGGSIRFRQDWSLPQFHNGVAIAKAGFDQWYNDIFPRLDLERMRAQMDRAPLDEPEWRGVLEQVWNTLSTDGASNLEPSGVSAGRSLASRRDQARFLVFKSADDWLGYQQRFGDADVFSTMIGHLDGMARDIARMDVLGPNPEASLNFIAQSVEKWAKEQDRAGLSTGSLVRPKFIDKANYDIGLMRDMHSFISGTTNTPIHGFIGRSLAGVRSMLVAAQLGSAAISAITDVNFSRMAAKHAGLKSTKVMGRLVKLLKPGSGDDQQLAVRLGLIAENWSTIASAQARYTGEIMGSEWTSRLADGVLRASGLAHWTQAGKWAFGMEFLGALGDATTKAFDDLNKPMQRTLAQYGIDAKQWDLIRTTELYEHEGARFLRPEDVMARADLPDGEAKRLAMRLMEMVQTETEFAVPSASIRGRAAVLGNNQPGTIPGELLRSTLMYKNFGITLWYTHIRRALNTPGGKTSVLGSVAGLAISTTLMGALALQLKELSKGRDPRSMVGDNMAKFWGAAFLQGGGLGIFGDFLFAATSRSGHGLGTNIAGPVAGLATDAFKLTVGNLVEGLTGQDTNAGREAVKFLRNYTPGGTIWYLRSLYTNAIIARLEEMADPRSVRNRRNAERRLLKDFGQRNFWNPDDNSGLLPDRAPDLSNALR